MANNAVVNILVVLDQLLHASKVTVISSREQYKYLHMYHMKVKRESEVAQSCPTLCDHMDTRLRRPWDFLGKRTGVGCPFLRHGIFPTQGSYPGLPHSRQTLYRQSHQGSWADWVGGGVVQRGGGAHQELGSGTSSVT